MQIGIVAKKIGLSVDAIRFYERNALLPRTARTEGGFRQYGESDVEALALVWPFVLIGVGIAFLLEWR
jgi:DNA-binding transcriptional MerR regulator